MGPLSNKGKSALFFGGGAAILASIAGPQLAAMRGIGEMLTEVDSVTYTRCVHQAANSGLQELFFFASKPGTYSVTVESTGKDTSQILSNNWTFIAPSTASSNDRARIKVVPDGFFLRNVHVSVAPPSS